MPEAPTNKIEDLGDEFEVLEDPGAPPAAGPAGAALPTGAPGRAAAGLGATAPLRSEDNWASLGLALALAGLLGEWNGVSFNLAHGLLAAVTVWALLRFGLATVLQAHARVPVAIPVALAVYGLARIGIQATGGALEMLAWRGEGGVPSVSGAVFTLVGGVVAALAKTLGGKADKALPPRPPEREVDKQFARSLFAYLLCFIGILMPWSAGVSGAASAFGVITLACVMLALWASWVGTWKLWGMSIVTGKLGLILFLAPVEAMILGLAGLALQMAEPPGFIADAWPTGAQPFLVYGGGPLLTLSGAGFALYLLLTGAKEAMAMSKEKKAQEVAARKAAREARKKK